VNFATLSLKLRRLGRGSLAQSLIADFANGIYRLGATTGTTPAVISLTVTRDGALSYYNGVGVLSYSGSNEGPVDYEPVTLGCKGLLLAPEATNLWAGSADLSVMTSIRSSQSANAGVAPDGTTTADRLAEDSTANDSHFVRRTISFTAGSVYQFTTVLDADGRNWARLELPSAAFGASRNAFFDLANGVVGTKTASVTAGIIALPSGRFRCWIRATATATASGFVTIALGEADNDISYSGDGTSGVLVWGTELKIGTTLDPYIPTAGATASRPAATIAVPGSGWLAASAGTLVVAGQSVGPGGDGVARVLFGFSNTASPSADDCVYVEQDATIPGKINAVLVSGGDIAASLSVSGLTLTAPFRCGLTWGAHGFNFAVNGVTGTPEVGVLSLPSGVDRLVIGGAPEAPTTRNFNGWINRIDGYRQNMAPAALLEAASPPEGAPELPVTGSVVEVFFASGQSNAVRGLVPPLAGPNYPYARLYMPASEYDEIWTGQFSDSNILPFDPNSVTGLEQLVGTSFGTTQLEGFVTRYAADNPDNYVCGFVSAEGGADVEALAEGGSTGCFEKSIAMTDRLVEIAANYGSTIKVLGLDWNQGEANSATATLGDDLETMIYEPYNTQIKAITGQAEDIILTCVQPSSFGNSSSGVRSLLDKALEDGNIVLIGPTYWQPWNPADWVHHTDYGVYYMGELARLAYQRKLDTGSSLPTHVVSATMSDGGTTITMTWNRNVEVVEDDDVVAVDPRTFDGLQARTGSSGSADYRTILSHTIDGDTSTIVIDSPFSGDDPQILIGMVGHGGDPRAEATIPRTTIRSVTPLGYSALDGKALHEWACHQQVFVEVT